MEFDRLVKRMSGDCRNLFESAVASASSRSHYAIDIEHWLAKALELQDPEVHAVLTHFDIAPETVQGEVLTALEGLKTGNEGFPKIAPDITRLLFESWMLASSQFQSLEIRSAHVLLALVDGPALRLRARHIAPSLDRLQADDIKIQCAGLLENGLTATAEGASGLVGMTKTPALDQYTIDLTEQARAGKMDPVLGRDDEIRQAIDVLCRRRQNNVILTGEAGVGKTAVVEGLALRIVTGDVPDPMKNVALRALDMGLLQAGAGVKGEFENRLKNVIQEIKQSPTPIILFIDEAHTLVGAGNQSGAGDAANLLKPALARGELRTIAATTWAEYKKYFENDAALTRRFQVVQIDEPSEARAMVMLRSVVDMLERHHQVQILDEAVASAVKLSHRYIAGRQLPDKCVSLLDTACARVSLSLRTKPASLERCERNIDYIETETRALQRENSIGYDHRERLSELASDKTALERQRETLQARWQATKKLVSQIVQLRRAIEAAKEENAASVSATRSDLTDKQTELSRLRAELHSLQSDQPLLYECVDALVVAEVVADWTGIPVGRMQTDEINSILSLRDSLEQRVIGQSHALELIAKTMQTARAHLTDPKRPLGVFMLVGPSGIGKTETALALAEQLYGSEKNITVINMSEFKEEHKVSLLMGSPPGYVGYGEGGVLTEAVRRKPYSVVLLDEIEKAHPGVQDIFYQVFDKGVLRDGEGRDIDFKNTVIIMTSNTASEQIESLCTDPDTRPDYEALLKAIGPTLRETYKPAFLGRIHIIPYYPLDEACLAQIANLQLEAIKQRFEKHYRVPLVFSEALVARITEQCQQTDTGARQIAAILNNSLLPLLAEKVLGVLATQTDLTAVTVDCDASGTFDVRFAEQAAEATQKTG